MITRKKNKLNKDQAIIKQVKKPNKIPTMIKFNILNNKKNKDQLKLHHNQDNYPFKKNNRKSTNQHYLNQ